MSFPVQSDRDLAALAIALGARAVAGVSSAEEALVRNVLPPPRTVVAAAKSRIERGEDLLGALFCSLRSPAERRPQGATYTPPPIVRAITAWAASHLGRGRAPQRVVDPGAGSGRFLVAAGRRFPYTQLLGVELDPLAALIARGHLATVGMAQRAEVRCVDYRDFVLAPGDGPTLFVGNPPYVRHHLIDAKWKAWLERSARGLHYEVSQLAGLHVYFFLATVLKAAPGDLGAFITAAEWLDVNYGRLVRSLFLGELGGRAINVIEPTASPFPDAATTAAITCFEIGSKPSSVRLRRVAKLDELGDLAGGSRVRRERLETANRWTPLTRAARKAPEGFVELGEICRVHRGQVTGANKVWIVPRSERIDLPDNVLFPTVTRAKELFAAGEALADSSPLRRVVDIPVDLDRFSGSERRAVDRFLQEAKSRGVDRGYIAHHRKAWWAVGLRQPAPILSTYMARRPPAFVLNPVGARHINIAHGLYPREALSSQALLALATYLSKAVTLAEGRTYAGGLTKFEPREMERLLVPEPARLVQHRTASA